MATSPIPAPTFGPKGFIVPQENLILAAVQSIINNAFGGDLNPALETPQGQLASSWTAISGNVNDTFLNMTQQFDPAYNGGRYQDAIARIYFLERKPPLPTVVQAVCAGATGAVIPLGALAQATDGNIYTCTQAGTIGASGSVTLTFECQQPGAIACPAHNLSVIYQTILGWDSIDNPTDGVIGQDVESDRDFEIRRFDSVANNALGFVPAILGSVWEIDGVIDALVTENFTGSPITFRGVTLIPHSVYVAVTGGDASAVAKAIWKKKSPGCDMNGNTTVVVYDDVSGYDPPLPSYNIKFQIPYQFPVAFSVNLANNAQIPSDVETQVQNAIISAFVGGDGGKRARIGDSVYASRFYAPVAALGDWVEIIAIDIGGGNAPDVSITGSIGGTGAVSVLTVASILSGGNNIAAGMFIGGSGGGTAVQVGTQILAQLGGSAGGTGTYSVSVNQIVPSTTLAIYAPNDNVVNLQADQQPITEAILISVTVT